MAEATSAVSRCPGYPMGDDLAESISHYRAEIEQLQEDLRQRPDAGKKIRSKIERVQRTICQTIGRAGKLLNKCKLVNGAGTVVACVVSAHDGFHVYRRTRRASPRIEFDLVNVGRLFSAEDIRALATRLIRDMSDTYIHSSNWERITDGLGKKNGRAASLKAASQRNWGIGLADSLLEQISSDLDPDHFTLAEIEAEYAAVSSTASGTPVYYDECLQLLEKAGRIVKNVDGSYRICQ